MYSYFFLLMMKLDVGGTEIVQEMLQLYEKCQQDQEGS